MKSDSLPRGRAISFILLIINILCSSQIQAKAPNVLVILVDDLGYGDLGVTGAPDVKSPHLDALFASGVRVEDFHANCPVCSPTRASLLTGLYPDRAGVPGVIRSPLPEQTTSWGNLRDDVMMLPSLLKTAGYRTGIVGKWHLGLEKPDRPNDRGFDHFHGWLGDMMDDYLTHRRHGINYLRLDEQEIDPPGHATDLFTDWAIDYIRSSRSGDPEHPWFLYLAYNAPHTPIQPPPDWLERVKAREPGISEQRAALVALIEHLDDGIGRVLSHLKSSGEADHTFILFTSDNGGQVEVGARNAPYRGGKQEMWQGGLRVATCASWPGHIAPGTETRGAVSLSMDIFPTVAAVAEVPAPDGIDGRSFLPQLLGEPFSPPERDLFWVRREGGPKYGGLDYHAVRRGDWKLFRNTPFEPYQMVNLKNDPAETQPVPREKAPKVYGDLLKALQGHVFETGNVPWR